MRGDGLGSDEAWVGGKKCLPTGYLYGGSDGLTDVGCGIHMLVECAGVQICAK